jgi:hypothetical protein
MLTPDVERMAVGELSADGLPRYGWTDNTPDPAIYTVMLIRAVAEWRPCRAQYDRAKQAAPEVVDNHSATGADAPDPATIHGSASPDDPPKPGPQERQSRVSQANPQDTSAASALDGRTEGPLCPIGGDRAPSHQLTRPYVR